MTSWNKNMTWKKKFTNRCNQQRDQMVGKILNSFSLFLPLIIFHRFWRWSKAQFYKEEILKREVFWQRPNWQTNKVNRKWGVWIQGWGHILLEEIALWWWNESLETFSRQGVWITRFIISDLLFSTCSFLAL